MRARQKNEIRKSKMEREKLHFRSWRIESGRSREKSPPPWDRGWGWWGLKRLSATRSSEAAERPPSRACIRLCFSSTNYNSESGPVCSKLNMVWKCKTPVRLQSGPGTWLGCVHAGPEIHGAKLFAAAGFEVTEKLSPVRGVTSQHQVHQLPAAGGLNAEHVDFRAEIGFGPVA